MEYICGTTTKVSQQVVLVSPSDSSGRPLRGSAATCDDLLRRSVRVPRFCLPGASQATRRFAPLPGKDFGGEAPT